MVFMLGKSFTRKSVFTESIAGEALTIKIRIVAELVRTLDFHGYAAQYNPTLY